MSGEVRLGLLGLGHVGSAVARAAAECESLLAARGARVRVADALVRDVSKPRACDVPFITNDPDAFFGRGHDVIVEVLGGVDPARTLVARALAQEIPVVTANKSLVAAAGPSLQTLARRHRVSFRFEASVVAGVPFLHALIDRPFAGAITGIEGILNGTSNYILTSMAGERCSFDEALARAQALGFAEPAPEADVSGRDAAEKLTILLRELGLASIDVHRVETTTLASVTSGDIERARRRGGALKPIARVVRERGRFRAIVSPEFVPWTHPLSRVGGANNGILLDSRFAGQLFFSGPGAGPDVTAATILDDVVEIAREEKTWSSPRKPSTPRNLPSLAPAR